MGEEDSPTLQFRIQHSPIISLPILYSFEKYKSWGNYDSDEDHVRFYAAEMTAALDCLQLFFAKFAIENTMFGVCFWKKGKATVSTSFFSYLFLDKNYHGL